MPSSLRSLRHASAAAAALLLSLALPAAAQQRAAAGRIEGTITDSLHRRPLAGALMLVTRVSPTPSEFYNATTDARGHYRLDSLSAGRYSVAFTHAVLDSVDLVLPSRDLDLAAGQVAQVDMATPSSATLLAGACPGLTLPKGTGALVGQVDDADRDQPLVGATVAITWSDITVDRSTLRPAVQVRSASTRTAEGGAFRFCGLPTGTWVLMQVQRDGRAGSALRVSVPDTVGVIVTHLSFSATSSRSLEALADTTAAAGDTLPTALRGTATLTGTVRGPNGQPLPDAQVRILDGAPTARTDSAGTFTLTGLPAGSQTLEARHVGFLLGQQRVDLRSNQTAASDLRLSRIVSLDSVRIVAQRSRYREFSEHADRRGAGTFLTEKDIAGNAGLETSDLIARRIGFRQVGTGLDAKLVSTRGIASIVGGACVANVVIDGVQHQDVNLVRPTDIGAIELYRGPASAPPEYDSACGVVVIWTKR